MVSVFFAAAACFYFWKSSESDLSANKYRDQVQNLQDEVDTLTAEKEKLQASMSTNASQLKTREEFLDEKEAKLAAAETRLEAGIPKPAPAPVKPPVSTATVPKKFADTIHKMDQVDGADVITRAGRPVLRVPNTSFFAPGDATLTPGGQALLNQIALSLADVSDSFELRIESYTDTDAESADVTPAKSGKPHFANGWELTAARASAIEKYYRDQTTLTFQNVLVSARGDSQPIATTPKDVAHNRRIEISLAPIPAAFHPDASTPDATKAKDKDKSADKTADKSPAKSVDKPDKTADKTPDKTAAKTTDKDKAKDTDKAQ
jgi:chemotaxis protein MotB